MPAHACIHILFTVNKQTLLITVSNLRILSISKQPVIMAGLLQLALLVLIFSVTDFQATTSQGELQLAHYLMGIYSY